MKKRKKPVEIILYVLLGIVLFCLAFFLRRYAVVDVGDTDNYVPVIIVIGIHSLHTVIKDLFLIENEKQVKKSLFDEDIKFVF